MHEKTAELATSSPDLPVRIACAIRFRELFGFDAAHVDAVKELLQGIRKGTGATVQDIVRRFHSMNGGAS